MRKYCFILATVCLFAIAVVYIVFYYDSSLLKPSRPVMQLTDFSPVFNVSGRTPLALSTAPSQLEPRNSTHSASFPYILSVNYANQLGSAASRLVQLLNVSIGWDRRMVEPFEHRSYFYGVPTTTKLKGIFRFSDLYNLSAVHMQMEKCFGRNATFSKFEEFVLNSTRKFILLVFLMNKKRRVSVSDCTTSQRNAFKKIEQQLNMHVDGVKKQMISKYGSDYHFRAVKAVCVDAYGGFSFKDLNKAVTMSGGRKLTIVLPNWHGLTTVPSNYTYYVNDSDFHVVRNVPPCDPYTFPHASLVVKAAEKFRISLNLSNQFIAIHIRIERLLQNDAKQQGYWDKCMDRFQLVVQALKAKYSNNAIAIHDYSKYGSSTCVVGPKSKCTNAKDAIVRRLKTWGVQTVSYDPAVFNRPTDSGFVALVEKELMASADHLLVVGGGWYQKGIIAMFKERQGRKQLFSLCDFTKGPDHLPGLTISELQHN